MKPRTIAALVGIALGLALFIALPMLFNALSGVLIALGVLVLYAGYIVYLPR